MWVMWKLVLVHSEMVLASVQDRCTVSTKCTIWSEIILDAPDGILGYVGHVESCSIYLEMMLVSVR